MTFGPGAIHFCIGAQLARLESEIVVDEPLRRVRASEPAGPPARLKSSFFDGIKRMPMRLAAA